MKPVLIIPNPALSEADTRSMLALWFALTKGETAVTTETATEAGFDFDAHYRAYGYGAIAWYVIGYEMIRDEDYEWSGIEYENTDRVRAVMVGDDRVFTFDVEELERIADTDFCRGCGQIGCGCEVWE